MILGSEQVCSMLTANAIFLRLTKNPMAHHVILALDLSFLNLTIDASPNEFSMTRHERISNRYQNMGSADKDG